ncbi:DgyrCDS2362 [Dimorphilus gyrociliatus]|uniref:Microsomal glutathione S-transferase 1 n=1 Tax=Dimorphilus gyrociliatus TaxID=2664684 RepID=A0A7I8VF66_9ANNE|nr:DgyrCDS2362 [Dimorphilus gyrociliatus]
MAENLLTFSNPVFAQFAYYSAISIGKMFAIVPMIVYRRFSTGTFANKEDVLSRDKKGNPTAKVGINESVERGRRNHLNDMENIFPFVLIGFFYVLTKPDLNVATWHFRVFAFSRIVHMLAYQIPIKQPTRALSFGVGMGTMLSMLYQVLTYSA